MVTIIHSEIFFFISSVGFIILGTLLVILCIKVIAIANTFHRITKKVEKDIDAIGDTTKEMIEEVRESPMFRFLTNSRKKRKK